MIVLGQRRRHSRTSQSRLLTDRSVLIISDNAPIANIDAFAKTHKMAKQKFRPTRLGGFSGAKAYIWYVEVLKKRRNAVGRNFCDAIKIDISGRLQ
jgi:hypothetical protein